MLPLATDWTTISSLATGAGTLVLAIATFASVRSSNRAARVAEAALQEQRRPVLAPSRLDDPVQKIMFVEGHWVAAAGGRAAVENVDGTVYLAISLRNVGSGIAVCQGWAARVGLGSSRVMPAHVPVDELRLQSRDLYIPSSDVGMWQGALRRPDDRTRAEVAEAIDARKPIAVELLYSDQVGNQRTITRFGLIPAKDSWVATTNRHWYLDWQGPRPDDLVVRAGEAVVRDQEAAAEERAAADSEEATAESEAAAVDGDGSADGVAAEAELRRADPAA